MIDWDRIRPIRIGDKINYTDETGITYNGIYKRILDEDTCVIEISGCEIRAPKKWICYGWRNYSKEKRICYVKSADGFTKVAPKGRKALSKRT